MGLFTLGVSADQFDLPHPRLGLPVILLVRRVVLRAFDQLRFENFSLASATEDEVTAALRSVIENNFRQTGSIPGFSRRTFDTVVRQGQVSNFDFTRLTKTPDLCFKLRNDDEEPRRVLSEYDALFVECKPIDKTHAAGSKYCDDGLCRFVRGDYGWAMEEGLMLGYARHGRTIEKHLSPEILDASRSGTLKTAKAPTVVAHPGATATKHSEALYITRHRRGFQWIANKGKATDIIVYHSWHNCS